jgi:drug/metabolite transporter (DMT)-like permease
MSRRRTPWQPRVMAADRSLALAFGALALAVLLWGTSYWPTEVAGRHASPITLAALRTFPAALVLLVLLPLLGARLPRGRPAVGALISGILMVTVFYYGVTEGTLRAGPGNAAVLANASPDPAAGHGRTGDGLRRGRAHGVLAARR